MAVQEGLHMFGAGMPAARLQSPQLNGNRGLARPPERAYSPLFHPPINFLPNPNLTPNLHMAPYLNRPPANGPAPHRNGYGSVSPPLAYPYDTANAGKHAYAKYLPYAPEGLDNGHVKMNGIQQFVGIRDGQGPWGQAEKHVPAVQFLKKQDSGLSHAGSGGSATLNNPVHKVPKVCILDSALTVLCLLGLKLCLSRLGGKCLVDYLMIFCFVPIFL